MDTPKSTIGKLLQQLDEEGKIKKLDSEKCEQQSKNIDAKLKAFTQEKQQKIAKDKTEFSTKGF